MRALAAAVALVLAALAWGAGVSPAVAASDADPDSSSSAVPDIPLVVILDVSDSMNERVGDVVKIQAAKRALEPIIRAQVGSRGLGIWTYPNDGDCGAGQYLVGLGSSEGIADITRRVDLQGAEGGTPTAAAMQAVVDDLHSRGITEANLLLVSDGESNCGGPPPCEVAAGLAATGFALTIQAVGFDISTQGRAELECIAAATGGHYFDASDDEQLKKIITELGVPQVQLTVSSNETPRAGEPTTITATLTNPSTTDAVDARVNLAFRDAGADTIFPAVVPPTIRVGNIPAGATVTRSWTIVAGQRGDVSSARFVVTAWSKGSTAATVEREFTSTTDEYTAGSLGPLFEGITAGGQSLVIMGDSYSSGEGTKNYLPQTASAVGACHRSSQTYLVPRLDAAGIRTEIIACSGAVTGDFLRTDTGVLLQTRATPQVQQFVRLSSTPGAVVMTAGGNDMGFAGVIAECLKHMVPDVDSCTDDKLWVLSKYAAIVGLQQPLEHAYENLWTVLNSRGRVTQRDGEFAPVIVLAYPQITHNSRLGGCDIFDSSEVRFANQLVMALNSRVKEAVAAVRARGYEVYFVDSTQYSVLPDHTVCAAGDARWINTLGPAVAVPPVASESFHPTADGYSAVTDAITEWSTTVTRQGPSQERKDGIVGPDIPFITPAMDAAAQATRRDAITDFDTLVPALVQQGGAVTVQGSGFLPGTGVVVQLRSQPLTLGTLTADADGTLSGGVLVPDFAATGSHELVVMGLDESGEYSERVVQLAVVPPTPLWWLPVVAASILAGLGALTLWLIALRSARRQRSQSA